MKRLALAALLGVGCAAPSAPSTATSSIHVVDGAADCAALSWPVAARVTSPFGHREDRALAGERHDGIDLAVPEGTPVQAACAGVVRYAGSAVRGYGRLLVLDHPGGLSTVYAHNQVLLVGAGAAVARGQVIARSGQTGRVTAPHLHFEVRDAGRPVDPLARLAVR